MNLVQFDRTYLARASEPDEIEVVRSDGSYLYGTRAKRYIDFTAGCCVGNLGWGNEVIRDAVRDFDGPDYVAPGYLYRPWAELAEMLAEMAPGQLSRSFRRTGGTEAVEIALHAAIAYTGSSPTRSPAASSVPARFSPRSTSTWSPTCCASPRRSRAGTRPWARPSPQRRWERR
jgi:4-aminobutyrate aminotransferase-like enzyme